MERKYISNKLLLTFASIHKSISYLPGPIYWPYLNHVWFHGAFECKILSHLLRVNETNGLLIPKRNIPHFSWNAGRSESTVCFVDKDIASSLVTASGCR